MTNPGFIAHRLALRLGGTVNVTPASDVLVFWEVGSGEVDAVTGASAVQASASGIIRGFGAEEPARSVLRQHAEIEAGDLILDVAADGLVQQFPSGTARLEDLRGVQFEWAGQRYVQKGVGEALATSWNVVIGNRRVGRTLLLRKAT